MKDYNALGAKVALESNADMTKAQTGGGGDYTPPAAGFCLLRLVGYFEIGKHAGTYLGKPTLKDYVQLVFEVSGPKHPPTELPDGTKVPHRITIEETYSLNEKARFFKLFQRMNYAGDKVHMVQLMGAAFKAIIIHRKYKKRGETDANASGIAVELYDKKAGTFTIEPPRVEKIDDATGMPTGEYRTLQVPEPITPLKAFLWDHSDMDDWNALFIDGEYPERKDDKGVVTAKAKSKNVLQNKIKSATNFKASPIYALIASAGGNLDIPDAEDMSDDATDPDVVTDVVEKVKAVAVPEGAAADDALNGVV